MKRLFIALFLCILAFAISTILAYQSSDPYDTVLITLLNTERVKNGLEPVIWESRLDTVAFEHSQEMAVQETLTHLGMDGSQFWQRVSATGYPLTLGAENVLLRGDDNVSAAFDQWLGSESHAANMLNPSYQEVGFDVQRSSSGRYFFTLILAAREDFVPVTLTFTPAPPTDTATPNPEVVASPTPTILSPVPVSVSTEVPTSTPIPVTAAPTIERVYPTARPTATLPPPESVSLATISASGQAASQYELKLIYTSQSLTLLNIAEYPVYVDGLTFESNISSFDVRDWDSDVMSASLEAFPSGGCLQVWSSRIGAVLNQPGACEVRHGWLATNTDLFWVGASTFTVYRFGVPVTNCVVAAGECVIDLDTEMIVATSASSESGQSSSVNIGNYDMRLVYDDTSFMLLNTSGTDLDIVGLGFASASGLFSVSDWDNGFLTTSLAEFPAGDCMQAWPVYLTDWPDKPTDCKVRHAWVAVNDTQTFWLDTDVFTVNRGGGVIATCRTSSQSCEFDLP